MDKSAASGFFLGKVYTGFLKEQTGMYLLY